MGKKVVILNGSPRRAGNTAALAAEFTRGAEEAGNSVAEFFWTAWISMAARDVSADTAAGNARVSKRMTWTKYTRQ